MSPQEMTVHEKKELKSEEATRPGRYFVPEVDIYETPEALWLRADMPGVDDRSVEIDLNDGVLTIEGEVSVKEYENLKPVYTEYNVGPYRRRFTLSKDIDAEKIQARMANGVLELQLPKAERAKPRKIAVSA